MRYRINKHRAARKFNKATGRTKRANMVQPLRGGWRL